TSDSSPAPPRRSSDLPRGLDQRDSGAARTAHLCARTAHLCALAAHLCARTAHLCARTGIFPSETGPAAPARGVARAKRRTTAPRSEEHTSELQSRENL